MILDPIPEAANPFIYAMLNGRGAPADRVVYVRMMPDTGRIAVEIEWHNGGVRAYLDPFSDAYEAIRAQIEPDLTTDAGRDAAGLPDAKAAQWGIQPTIDLNAIEARASAAAEGPWSRYETVQADTFVVGPRGLLLDGAISGPTYNRENCEFIAHARTDVPALVAEVRRLHEQLAEAYADNRALPRRGSSRLPQPYPGMMPD